VTATLFNKTFLAAEQRRLQTYRAYLPALELKRQQLIGLLSRERAAEHELQTRANRITDGIGRRIPMLAIDSIDVDGLVRVAAIDLEEENVLGTPLPRLAALDIERADYGLLTRPHWVDVLVEELMRSADLAVRLEVAVERRRRLELATRVISQRVNLFEKILIPRATANIRKVRIFLSDASRYSAVRAKIAKAKRQQPA